MAKVERKLHAPTGPILSKYLRSLAMDVETIDDEGDPVTKAEALAKLVWRHALGFKDVDKKDGSVVYNPPDWRAIELLYARIEGKIPIAVLETSGRSLTEKVSDLGKARLNSLARASAEDTEEAEDEA